MARGIDGVLVHPPAPWRISDLDVAMHGTIDGKTGASRLAGSVRDARGPLLAIEASSRHVPYPELLNDSGRAMSDLQAMDVALDVACPERGLMSLPPILRQKMVTGRLQASVDVRGTLGKPTVDVVATLTHAGFAGNATTLPMDVDVDAHYDGQKGEANVKARGRQRELIDLRAQFEAAMADLLGASGEAPLPWTASLHGAPELVPAGLRGAARRQADVRGPERRYLPRRAA